MPTLSIAAIELGTLVAKVQVRGLIGYIIGSTIDDAIVDPTELYTTSALLACELIAIACDVITVQVIRSILAIGKGTAEQGTLIASIVAGKVQLLVAATQIAWISGSVALIGAIFTVLEAITEILAIDALLCAATLKSRCAIGACWSRHRCRLQLGYAVGAGAIECIAIGTTANGTFGCIQTHARTLGQRTGTGLLWQRLCGHIKDTQINGIPCRLQVHSGTEGVRLICMMHTEAPNGCVNVVHPIDGTIVLDNG